MTLYEFDALNSKEKEKETMHGEFLASRLEAGQTVALYGIHSFYVEVWYDGTLNEITRLNSFRSLERLAPYLSNINFGLRF